MTSPKRGKAGSQTHRSPTSRRKASAAARCRSAVLEEVTHGSTSSSPSRGRKVRERTPESKATNLEPPKKLRLSSITKPEETSSAIDNPTLLDNKVSVSKDVSEYIQSLVKDGAVDALEFSDDSDDDNQEDHEEEIITDIQSTKNRPIPELQELLSQLSHGSLLSQLKN